MPVLRSPLLALLAAAPFAFAADEPQGMYCPGSENLDAAGHALLAQGNQLLKASFHALNDHGDVSQSEALLEQAIVVQSEVMGLIGEVGPSTVKAGLYGKAHKNRDINETAGGLDGFVEMEMKSLTTTTDYDFKVHQRRVLANFASEAKKIEAAQKMIVAAVKTEADKVHSHTGGTGKPADAHTSKLTPANSDDEKPDEGPRRMATSSSPTAPSPEAATAPHGGAVDNALLTKQATSPTPPSPTSPSGTAKPTPAPDGKTPTGLPQPATSGATLPQQGIGSGQPDANAKDLAGQQAQVAARLDRMAATARAQGAAGNDIADRFQHAADLARAAAKAIANGDPATAQAATGAAQRAIQDALAAANGTTEALRREQTSALEQDLAHLQARQAQVVSDAHALAQAIAAGTAAPSEAQTRTTTLAGRQAGLAEDIAALTRRIDELAEAGVNASGDRAAQAVREDLHAASSALRDGRARQEAVNATVAFQQGHLDQAAATIARASTALEQAHAHLASAADAAAGGHQSDRTALSALQGLSSALRRLADTTQAAVDGAKAEQQQSGAAHADEDHADRHDPASPGTPSPTQANALPPTMGHALEGAAQALTAQLEKTLSQMPQVSAEDRQRIQAAVRQRIPLASDPTAGIAHLESVVAEVERVEATLVTRISEDQSHAALQTFLQDPVPASYTASVAAYYQLLAGDAGSSGSTSASSLPGAGGVTP